MLSQITTMIGEVAAVGQVLLGGALLLLWVAFEAIGYGGLLFFIARDRGWIDLGSRSRSKPVRKARHDGPVPRWGLAVRAAGLRRQSA